jgi:hypothetical protein
MEGAMRSQDGTASVGIDPRSDGAANTKPEEPKPPTALGVSVVPAALALGAGGVVLAVAIAWGAAEAAVAVGAGYLVYSAITARGDLAGSLAVRLLTGVLRRKDKDEDAEATRSGRSRTGEP